MKEKYNIDGLFREGLHDHAETPPLSSWERLNEELGKRGKTRVVPLFVRYAAAVVIIGVVAVSLWLRNPSPEQIMMEDLTLEDPQELPSGNEEPANIQNEIFAEDENSIRASEASIITNKSDAQDDVYADNNAPLEPLQKTGHGESTNVEIAAGRTPAINRLQPVSARLPEAQPDFSVPAYDFNTSGNINDYILAQNIAAAEAEAASEPRESSSWRIGGQAGPQYTYRDASNEPFTAQSQNNFNNIEEGVIAFAGGVNLELQRTSRWGFQSGVYYSKIGQQSSTYQLSNNGIVTSMGNFVLNDAPQADPNTLEPTGAPAEEFAFSKDFNRSLEVVTYNAVSAVPAPVEIEQYMEYVEIPFVVSYRMIDRRLGVNLSGGLWTNFLINDYYTISGPASTFDDSNLNPVNYIGSIGLGFDYPFSEDLFFSLEPVFKYYISPVNSGADTEVHPYSLGVMTGISYSF